MKGHKRKSTTSPKNRDILAYTYKRLKTGKPVLADHAEHENTAFESVREIAYRGHHIVIRTHYDIRIDGKRLKGHMYVDNYGRVSSHALPAYSFVSAVDLIKKLIDMFGDNFPKVSTSTRARRESR